MVSRRHRKLTIGASIASVNTASILSVTKRRLAKKFILSVVLILSAYSSTYIHVHQTTRVVFINFLTELII